MASELFAQKSFSSQLSLEATGYRIVHSRHQGISVTPKPLNLLRLLGIQTLLTVSTGQERAPGFEAEQ